MFVGSSPSEQGAGAVGDKRIWTAELVNDSTTRRFPHFGGLVCVGPGEIQKLG